MLGVTANVIVRWPLLPSTTDAELTLRRGVESSSMIVPVALATAIVALTGFDRRSVRVSLLSFVVSPTIWTLTIFDVCPGEKVSVPVSAT